ncbi:MAG: sensor histidine kinase [Christensenellales bacterium]
MIALSAIFISYGAFRRERERFIAATAGNVENSLELLDDALHAVGTHFSHLAPLIGIYSGIGGSLGAVESVYDVVLATANNNSMIADVIVVTPDGKARSYANGEGMYLVELVSTQYDYTDDMLVSHRYFFFPNYAFSHDEVFAYVVPLLDVDAASGRIEKLASILIACYSSNIQSIVMQGRSVEYAYVLTASDGAVVACHTPDHFPEQYQIYNRTLAYPYRSIEIHSTRAWPFNSGATLEIIAGGCAAIVLVTLFAILVIRTSILSPIHAVTDRIARIGERGDVGRLAYSGVQEVDLITKSINEMLDRTAELSHAVLEARTGLIEAQLRKNEAELYALQSQINPHFLFNSMQCIRAMAVLAGASDVASMTSSLSSLLRYAISGTGMVRVREEIDAVKEYLNIVDIRYAHRFQLDLRVPAHVMDIAIPKMILQPIVENAIHHGVSTREEGGRVAIAAYMAQGQLLFTVSDDGPGISAAQLNDIREMLEMDFHDAVSARKLTSFGLYNIQRRIRLGIGEACGLSIDSSAKGTKVTISISAEAKQR